MILNRFVVIVLFVNLSILGNSQTMAIMETGDTIYVYSDGSWSYFEEEVFEVSDELDFLGTVRK